MCEKKSYLTLVAIFFFFFFGLGSLVPSSMESISKILGGKGGPKRQGSETSNLPPNNAPPGAAHSCVCHILGFDVTFPVKDLHDFESENGLLLVY